MRRASVAAVIGLALVAAPAPTIAAPSLALDPSFGNGGTVLIPAAPGSNDTRLYDTVALPDGSTVSTGAVEQSSGNDDLVFVKRKADGSADDDFGTNGVVTVPVNLVAGGDDVLYRVIFGGGVITGVGDVQAASGRDLVVAQVDQQGNPTGFGGGDGIFTRSFGTFDSFRGGVRLATGDIAVGGSTTDDAINGNAVLALVEGDGSPSTAASAWSTPHSAWHVSTGQPFRRPRQAT